MSPRLAVVQRLFAALLREKNDQGWPYYAGKSARIEPTAWALLALGSNWEPAAGAWTDFARPHVEFLGHRHGTEGLLSDVVPGTPNLTANAMAAIALTRDGAPADSGLLSRLLEGLVNTRGVRLPDSEPGQDNRLQGWPWFQDTFSWVEPTAWCLLALKKAGVSSHSASERLRQGEQLLINRTCRDGGWNYGNAVVQRRELRPHVPTTAIGLLALQDRPHESAVQRSLSFLEDSRRAEDSTMALSLTGLALRVHGRPSADVEERLLEVVARAERLGNLQSLAVAAYALTADRHKVEALRV